MKSTASIVFACGILLTGCSSMPQEQPNLLNRIQHDELKQTVDDHINEYTAAKPSLDRLIELESDLRMLVTQIANYQAELPKAELVKNTGNAEPIQSIEDIDVNFATKNNTPDVIASGLIDNPMTVVSVPTTPVIAIKAAPTKIPTTLTASQDLGSDQTPKVNTADVPKNQYTTCVPQDVEVSAQLFGIHIASFKQRRLLDTGWGHAVLAYPSLCDKGAVVKTVTVQETVFYSLRVGPYDTKQAAKDMCQRIRQQKQYCRVTDFSGEAL